MPLNRMEINAARPNPYKTKAMTNHLMPPRSRSSKRSDRLKSGSQLRQPEGPLIQARQVQEMKSNPFRMFPQPQSSTLFEEYQIMKRNEGHQNPKVARLPLEKIKEMATSPRAVSRSNRRQKKSSDQTGTSYVAKSARLQNEKISSYLRPDRVTYTPRPGYSIRQARSSLKPKKSKGRNIDLGKVV